VDINLRQRNQSPKSVLEKWLPLSIAFAVLILWESLVHMGWISPLFFPAPSFILVTFIKLIGSGKLSSNIMTSLIRLFLGFVLGGLFGLILGLLMGSSSRLRFIIDPFIAACHPIPKIAILPLFMIIFGIGESSKVIVVAVSTFFPMVINTMAGVRQISPIHFEVAKNYGASPTKIFLRVIVPGSLPLIFTGVRLALNMALLLTIAVELVSSQEGLGAMIWLAWQTLRTEELYVSLAVTAILGIIFNFLLERISLHLVPWQTEQEI
jgi:ABC-type nitrate/sulfonate/bicarbonate transport system permease component